MLAKDIEAYEINNHKVLNLKTSTDLGFPLVFMQKENGYFFKEMTKKEIIVLHHTAGFLGSDLQTLTKPNYTVSVPFVLGRNGIVYQLFSTQYWSYSLGASAVGNNAIQSKRSIAIEISNIGPLTLKGNDLYTAYNTLYCGINDTQYYTKLEKPYRGIAYFASFTDAQYDTLNKLITQQCKKWNIPRTFIEESKRYNTFTTEEALAYKGISSHVNYRADKSDLGPAFDWKRIS